MRQTQAWITSDGRVFTSQRAAGKHAEERFGNALTRLAHQVVRVEKYSDAAEWIEQHLPAFLELDRLRVDRDTIETEEQD